MAEPNQHRRAGRRRLVAACQRFAGLDQAERFGCVDAERFEILGRKDFTHTALQGEPSIAPPRPRCLSRALGAEIEQSSVVEIVQLREQKSAAVAEVGIVTAELMAVITQRQRRWMRAGQRFEFSEMRNPFVVAQRVEPDALCPALVAMTNDVLRKIRRRDFVVKRAAERGMRDRWAKGRRGRHCARKLK